MIIYIYVYTQVLMCICLFCALLGCAYVNPYLSKVQSQCPGMKGCEQDRTEQTVWARVGQCGTSTLLAQIFY